jgi:redox-sensing transcriptional repressor
MDKLEQVVKEENIRMAIICVPGAVAQQEADRLIHAGVCGILNFAPVPIRVPTGVTLEEIDVTCSLEKVAYFTTHSARGEKGSNEKR